jgi:hypothetical protein
MSWAAILGTGSALDSELSESPADGPQRRGMPDYAVLGERVK